MVDFINFEGDSSVATRWYITINLFTSVMIVNSQDQENQDTRNDSKNNSHIFSINTNPTQKTATNLPSLNSLESSPRHHSSPGPLLNVGSKF